MADANTTVEVLKIATDRLNWYIGFSIVGTLTSMGAVVWSIYYNRKQIENSNKLHKESLDAQKEQLKANHDWNRRQLVLTELMSNRDSLTSAIKSLNNSINYREQKDSYSLAEIHKALCNDDNYERNPSLTDDGKKVKHHIFIILNYFEYFAVGLKNKVFNEKVLKDSIKGSLLKANKVFGSYIEHLRSEKHGGNKKLFIELETLAIKWTREDKIDNSSDEAEVTG